MRHLGSRLRRRCDCRYCVGDGDSKPVLKSLKHGARQKVKKEINDQLPDSDRRRKKAFL